MSECTHDCSSCGANCPSKKQQEPQYEPLHELSSVKRVIGVVSGKGGVGKSLVTSMLAVLSKRKNLRTAILDADITGPSIPKAFGLKGVVDAMDEHSILPADTRTGIKVMSINLLLPDVTSPVIWRGPILAGTVKQFWSEVVWGDVDFMYVDMPPGTGDVPLTVFQSLPIDGIIIVTTPQDLVTMIVEKAVKMAEMMNIPVLGLVENLSYYECPDCHKRHEIFGSGHPEKIAEQYGIKHVARIPIDHDLANQCDQGMIELFEGNWLDEMSDAIEKEVEYRKK